MTPRNASNNKKVFTDGSAGTTGLQIAERLKNRDDIELITLPDALRKDTAARAEAINSADIVFLCLPDDAAREAVSLVSNPNTCIIDTSTAHRTNPEWTYGFPELGFAQQIAASKRIANPGCHATGAIASIYPLVSRGIIDKDAFLTCFSLTGYSGGGKKMIADYEAPDSGAWPTAAAGATATASAIGAAGAENTPSATVPASPLQAPGIYGLTQAHKHLPEIRSVCGLSRTPTFCPIVDNYYKGMATTLCVQADQLARPMSPEDIAEELRAFYANSALISVAGPEETAAAGKLYANAYAGRDSLKIYVGGNATNITLTALFDNLGKGASGSAVENMNIVLGIDPTFGLHL